MQTALQKLNQFVYQNCELTADESFTKAVVPWQSWNPLNMTVLHMAATSCAETPRAAAKGTLHLRIGDYPHRM
jgi:hypothetical protein